MRIYKYLLCLVVLTGCVTRRGVFEPPPELKTVNTPESVANRIAMRLLMTSPLSSLKEETRVRVESAKEHADVALGPIAALLRLRLGTVPQVTVLDGDAYDYLLRLRTQEQVLLVELVRGDKTVWTCREPLTLEKRDSAGE